MSTTAAKMIRDELKTVLGLSAKQVSVRNTSYGVFVDVKVSSVNIAAVESIAHKHISHQFDHATGEQLLGGTSVHGQYTDAALAPIADLVSSALTEAVEAGNASCEYRDIVVYAADRYEFAGENCIVFGSEIRATHGLKFTARRVAEIVLRGQAGHGCTAHTDCLAHHAMAVECASQKAVA